MNLLNLDNRLFFLVECQSIFNILPGKVKLFQQVQMKIRLRSSQFHRLEAVKLRPFLQILKMSQALGQLLMINFCLSFSSPC